MICTMLNHPPVKRVRRLSMSRAVATSVVSTLTRCQGFTDTRTSLATDRLMVRNRCSAKWEYASITSCDTIGYIEYTKTHDGRNGGKVMLSLHWQSSKVNSFSVRHCRPTKTCLRSSGRAVRTRSRVKEMESRNSKPNPLFGLSYLRLREIGNVFNTLWYWWLL